MTSIELPFRVLVAIIFIAISVFYYRKSIMIAPVLFILYYCTSFWEVRKLMASITIAAIGLLGLSLLSPKKWDIKNEALLAQFWQIKELKKAAQEESAAEVNKVAYELAKRKWEKQHYSSCGRPANNIITFLAYVHTKRFHIIAWGYSLFLIIAPFMAKLFSDPPYGNT